MPAYDEAATIEGVLDDLYPRIDRLIVVNDGSNDDTGPIVDRWAVGKSRVTAIHFPENRGLSAALRAGWDEVRGMLARGEINPADIAFSIDADGQHEPAALDGMIDHLIEKDVVCVIGDRDMGYHSPYKKFGNSVMTWIGSVSGGHKFYDIESGYRVFRVGPLLEAQEYYRGYKYSETVEVAVLLTRLGYRVDNSYRINIPVGRTRTRLYDAAVDAVCMPLAWYRLSCWRRAPAASRRSTWLWVPPVVIFGSLLAMLAMLAKRFYLGDDSAHSYAHVWYLSESIFTRHEWPWHVAQLENGDAVMFPYGIIPWLPDALLYPILGDWVVTLSMVLGCALLVAGIWRFRPQMKNPLLFTVFLLNPLLWNGITQFQLTTVWSFALFFFGAALFESKRTFLATLLLALAVATHPLMGIAAISLYGAWEWVRQRSFPRPWATVSAVAAILASPAFLLFLSTPALGDASPLRAALSVADNMRRLSIVLLPLLLPAMGPAFYRHQGKLIVATAALTVAVLVWVPPSGLWQRSQPRFAGYLAANPVVPGDSYRVTVKNNQEDGMVQFMKAGATLSNEFFTESQHRQTFPTLQAYTCLLATKQVDHVVISGAYPARFRTNELRMLGLLAQDGQAEEEFRGADGTIAFRVHPPESARRTSLRECGL
ncbi:MAG: glycosyltransferase family 2 protein [Tepidiformaceae bacterium]